jgi:hypothetical protein
MSAVKCCGKSMVHFLLIGRVPKLRYIFVSFVAGRGMVGHRTESAAKRRIKRIARNNQDSFIEEWEII